MWVKKKKKPLYCTNGCSIYSKLFVNHFQLNKSLNEKTYPLKTEYPKKQ